MGNQASIAEITAYSDERIFCRADERQIAKAKPDGTLGRISDADLTNVDFANAARWEPLQAPARVHNLDIA